MGRRKGSKSLSLREKIARLFGRVKRANKDIVDAFVEACGIIGIRPTEALERLMWNWLKSKHLEDIYLMRLPPRFQPFEYTLEMLTKSVELTEKFQNVMGVLAQRASGNRSKLDILLDKGVQLLDILSRVGAMGKGSDESKPSAKKKPLIEEVEEPLTLEDLEGE